MFLCGVQGFRALKFSDSSDSSDSGVPFSSDSTSSSQSSDVYVPIIEHDFDQDSFFGNFAQSQYDLKFFR